MSKSGTALLNELAADAPARHFARLLATGFCFLLFGGGIGVFALAVAALRIFVPDSARRITIVQQMLGILMRTFRRIMCRLGLIQVRTEGLHLMPHEPCIIVCNHPTLIDAPLLLSYFPKLCCIVKGTLYDRWAYRTAIQALGFLPIGSSEHPVERCVEAVRAGRSVLVFPEGTRSPASGLHPFARGAVTVALRTGAPIIPIVLGANPPTLGKHQRWYQIPSQSVDFSISVRYPFLSNSCPVDRASERELSLQLTEELDDFFKRATQ